MRLNQRTPARSEYLEIDMGVARIDCGDHTAGPSGRDMRRGEGGKGREPDGGLAGRERNPARCRDAYPHPGEAAGPVVTAIRSISLNSIRAASITRANSGINASA